MEETYCRGGSCLAHGVVTQRKAGWVGAAVAGGGGREVGEVGVGGKGGTELGVHECVHCDWLVDDLEYEEKRKKLYRDFVLKR